MKRILSTLMIFAAAIIQLQAQRFQSGELWYNIPSADAKIVMVTYEKQDSYENYQTISPEVVVPETVVYEQEEYLVKGISANAFAYCESLTKVTLPESLCIIGDNAFSNCSSLAEINIPKGVDRISTYAFSWCISLKAINVSEENTHYCSQGGVLFNADKTLLIRFPQANETTEYVVPETVTEIANSAFYGCSSLTKVTLPESLQTIGDIAFTFCTALAEINIPKNVTQIGTFAVFSECTSLKAINVSEANTHYSSQDGVLFNADKTLLIRFPQAIETTEYAVPETVTEIAEQAFHSCESLTKVILPKSLQTIGDDAFYRCISLAEINISEGVTQIGKEAFYACGSLNKITVLAENPPAVVYGAFDWIAENPTVYVPASALEAYRQADTWKEFNLQPIDTGTAIETITTADGLRIEAGRILNPQAIHIEIIDLNGRLIYTGADVSITLPEGIYVVRSKGISRKVMIAK